MPFPNCAECGKPLSRKDATYCRQCAKAHYPRAFSDPVLARAAAQRRVENAQENKRLANLARAAHLD